MFRTKRAILNALQFSPDGTGGEGAAGGATANGQSGAAGNGQGASSLPAGVAPGSAAAQAHEQAQAAATAAQQQANNAGSSTGTVPVAELAEERKRRQALEAQVTELKTGQEQFMAGIKNAFGLQEQPTPEQLAAAATTAQSQATEANRQLAVYRTAAKAGGDPAKLLDSASFLATLKTLDPTNDSAVETAIKAAVEANKSLGIRVQSAGSGDAGRPGSTGGSSQPGLNDLFRAAAHTRGSGDD
jgi:hypothetical protein